jgi:RimJ/RimL family protein N-acetyltransferase
MREWLRNPETARTWGRAPIVTDDTFEDDLGGRFRHFEQAGYFAIEDEHGDLVGRIDYEHLDPVDRTAELMIMIGGAEHRGRGIGSDALRTLIHHLFRAGGYPSGRRLDRWWLARSARHGADAPRVL